MATKYGMQGEPRREATADEGSPPGQDLRQPRAATSASTWAAIGLLCLACLYTLYLAREVVLPITLAIVLGLVLAPLLRLLARLHVPRPVGAALVVLGFTGSLAYGIYSLWDPVIEWRNRMPQLISEMEFKLQALKQPVEEVRKASEEVERIANLEITDEQPDQVVVKPPSLLARVFSGIQEFGIQLAITLVLLYFLLASGDIFREKLIQVMPTLKEKKRAVRMTRQVEREVSTYLLTITLINIGLGAAIGAGLYAAGLPNAPLWGVMAAFLNYLPYLGALTGTVTVGIVGLLSFDSLAEALAPPAIYIGMNIVESQFITPSALGQRFTLNPVIIFVAVVFWGWLWGPLGALLAVPLLVIVKAVCDHVDSLAALGEFLRGRGSERRKRKP